MKWQSVFRETLCQDYAESKKKNPKFSIRSYARFLGLPASTLSLVMRGKSLIRVQRAAKLVLKFKIKQTEKNYLLNLMGMSLTSVPRKDIGKTQYNLLTDWVYLAVLYFYELDITDKSPEHLAKRLCIPESKVKQVIKTLKENGLLQENAAGGLSISQEQLNTSDDIPDELIRQHHKMNLNLSERVLDLLPVDKRDYTSYTFTTNSSQYATIKKEIRAFYEKISASMEHLPNKDEVYRISIQFHPLRFFKKD